MNTTINENNLSTEQLREPYRLRVSGHRLAVTPYLPQGDAQAYPGLHTG